LAPLATQNKVLYISGPAKIDLLTTPGSPFASRYVFRSGAQSAQDVAALKSLPVRGKKVALFVEDNAFGNGNIAAVERVLGAKGATFIEVKVSTTATDFLPYTTKVAAAKPAYVFVAWSNSLTAGLAFTGLKQQGLFQSAHMVTGLANVAAYQITGGLFDGANGPVMTNSYFPGVSKTAIGAALAADYAKSGAAQDLFTPDGVNAAQMILKALKGNTDLNVDTMITNLQGFSFLGVKGRMMVRSNDHVLVQPMYTVALAKVNGVYAPQLLGTVYNVAP
jgi:branched-chain amino acid transport system substrate-binding protein